MKEILLPTKHTKYTKKREIQKKHFVYFVCFVGKYS